MSGRSYVMKWRLLLFTLSVAVVGSSVMADQSVQKITRISLKYVSADAAFTEVVRMREQDERTSDAILKNCRLEDGRLSHRLDDLSIVTEPRTNAVLLVVEEGSEKVSDPILEFLKALDVRPATVLISAVQLEVALGESKEKGLDLIGKLEDVMIAGNKKVSVEALKSSDSQLTVEERTAAFEAYAKALEGLDSCRVLARPMLYVRDGERGAVSVGQVISPQVDGDDPLEIASEFEILPTITSETTVNLRLTWRGQQLSELKRRPEDEGVQETVLETELSMPDGGVAVLGGMVRDEDGVRKEQLYLIHARVTPGDEGRG